MKARRLFVGALLMAGLLPAPLLRAAGWWNFAWQYRRGVTIPETRPSGLGGDDVAILTMPTAGLLAEAGKDVRVATAQGKVVAHRVLMTGPGDVLRLAFAIQRGVKKYYVYFGNPKAKSPDTALEVRRGVLLEMWKYPGGGIRRLEQVRRVLQRAASRPALFIGRAFRDRVFLGHNPFSSDSKVASIFTGWLICPRDGTYAFATSSKDASFLLVDDKLVVDNGGAHRPQRDIRKRGKIELKAGLHKLTFYHVSMGGHPIAVAAWRPPKAPRIWTIGSGSFAPVVRAVAKPLEQYAKALTIDFMPIHAGETFMKNRYYQRYAMEAAASGTAKRGIQWSWDFGDGQTATGNKVEHVYLVPGEYKVILKARTFAGEMVRANRIFVSRPWDEVTSNRLDRLRDHAAIVAKYDFAALPTKAVGEAVLLLDRAGDAKALLRAGQGLVGRDRAPPNLLREVMPLYAEALVAAGEATEAVAALRKAAQMTRNAAVCSTLLVRGANIALQDRGDDETAMKLFEEVLKNYSLVTTSEAIRAARIGIGDVWRARGDAKKAREAYELAKQGPLGGKTTPIVRGDYARQVEDNVRNRRYEWAEEALRKWESILPLDKLEGYSSLLKVRLLTAQKRYSAAAREAEVLVKVNPASNYAAELLTLAADAYEKRRQPDKAKGALQRVVKDYPESPLAAKAAKRLGRN